jgi:hypothetical protein
MESDMHHRFDQTITLLRRSCRLLLMLGATGGLTAAMGSSLGQSVSRPTTAPMTEPSHSMSGMFNQPGTLMMPPTPLAERLVAIKPLASDYVVLKHRSIFIHGEQTHDTDDARPATDSSTSVARPQAVLIFNGVARVNDQLAAFFEDTDSHEVVIRHQGDALAQGRVTNITLDSIDYDAGGHVTHVALGQSLDGGNGTSLADQPTGSFSGNSGSSSGSGDSVLDRLRRRRQQQLGH